VNSAPEGPVQQPESFEFTPDNIERAKAHIAKYPAGRQQSAVLPLLDLAQRQSGGWLPQAAMHCVADMLGMPRIRVYEVATFYTMLNLRPVGRYFLQACTTTPCWLRGSDAVVAACEKKLAIGLGGTSADGLFTLLEVECLGACVNAPLLQVHDEFYEDLDGPATEALIDALREGKPPPIGSVIGRQGSAPIKGKTTLTGLPEPPPVPLPFFPAAVLVPVLLFEQQRSATPAPERRLPAERFLIEAAEVELAAVVGPPAARDRIVREAGAEALPILANETDVTGAAQGAALQPRPRAARRLQ